MRIAAVLLPECRITFVGDSWTNAKQHELDIRPQAAEIFGDLNIDIQRATILMRQALVPC